MKKETRNLIIIMIILIVIDQISKILITNLLNDNVLVIIPKFLKFIYVENTGAAFGILSGNIFILILISLGLIYYIYEEIKRNKSSKVVFSYTLVLSGALGNLIDRIFRGYVVDFVSFTLFNKEMAVFNIADSYITVGVILLLYFLIKEFYNESYRYKMCKRT